MKVRFIVLLIVLLVFTSVAISVADELGTRYLQKGMRGADVFQLQEILMSLGYDLGVDGIFGSETDMRVREFQLNQSLTQDGIVGSKTLTALQHTIQGFFIYTVKSGDTLYDLANTHNITLGEIISINQLSSTLIRPGQELVIPNAQNNGELDLIEQEYVVKKGDNLSVIAQQFGLSANEIASINRISDPNIISAGQKLTIPVATMAAMTERQSNRSSSIPVLDWPVKGRISSPYGWRVHPINNVRHFHGGIDIAIAKGTTVRAAAAGTVIEAGWMGDYGLGIVIDHGGGYTTWYGHNSQILVRVGDRVVANQPISAVGSTGLSTGPHLDFRIKYYDQTLDPLDFLP